MGKIDRAWSNVRFWPEADMGPRSTAGKDVNVGYRPKADIDAVAEL